MRIENSAGGIVFRIQATRASRSERCSELEERKRKNDIFILMIRDHNDKYTFPKGLIEKGESIRNTSLREVFEETGITAEIIEKLDDLKFFFVRDGERTLKTVSFYLMKTDQIELKPQWEVKGAEWIPIEEAVETAIEKGYKNQQALIELAIKKIKKVISKKSLKDF